MYPRFRNFLTAALCLLAGLVPQCLFACPTCKDSLTDNYVQAYGMSIIFMMSMPFIIFGALSAYFYYEVCKARRQKAVEQSRHDPSGEAQSRDQWSRESLTSATTVEV